MQSILYLAQVDDDRTNPYRLSPAPGNAGRQSAGGAWQIGATKTKQNKTLLLQLHEEFQTNFLTPLRTFKSFSSSM
jgi:hypothetical protein